MACDSLSLFRGRVLSTLQENIKKIVFLFASNFHQQLICQKIFEYAQNTSHGNRKNRDLVLNCIYKKSFLRIWYTYDLVCLLIVEYIIYRGGAVIILTARGWGGGWHIYMQFNMFYNILNYFLKSISWQVLFILLQQALNKTGR